MTTPLAANQDLLNLLFAAGPFGKAILLFLFLLSITSWGIIFAKIRIFHLAEKQNREFLMWFMKTKQVDKLTHIASQMSFCPVASVFESGIQEASHSRLGGEERLDHIQRSLQRSSILNLDRLDSYNQFLATISNASPFIGLLGTVWGIMRSFQSIAALQSASLAVVAPGIAEALITTAMGIATAIPASMAYNVFANKMRKHSNDLECFHLDFLNWISSERSHRTQI
jgi:biopolymer transport protein TolQ